MTQERTPGFYPHPEDDDPYNPEQENTEFKLTAEVVAEFAADFKRIVDIAKLEVAQVPREGVYFVSLPNRKIGYVENPFRKGAQWNGTARLYSITIGSESDRETYYDPLVTLTNAPQAFERKDGARFEQAKVQFSVALLENEKTVPYTIYFWEVEPEALQLIDEILNSFIFQSIPEVSHAVINGENRTYTDVVSQITESSEPVQVTPQEQEKQSPLVWLSTVISRKLAKFFHGKAS